MLPWPRRCPPGRRRSSSDTGFAVSGSSCPGETPGPHVIRCHNLTCPLTLPAPVRPELVLRVSRLRLCGVGVVTAARNAGLFVLSVVVSPQSHLSVDASAPRDFDVPRTRARRRSTPALRGRGSHVRRSAWHSRPLRIYGLCPVFFLFRNEKQEDRLFRLQSRAAKHGAVIHPRQGFTSTIPGRTADFMSHSNYYRNDSVSGCDSPSTKRRPSPLDCVPRPPSSPATERSGP
jgi:hypothetical protein